MKFKITTKHPVDSSIHIFNVEGINCNDAVINLWVRHPKLIVQDVEELSTPKHVCKNCSPAKRRGHYKARLCQVRGNLQSMTDSEEGLLTTEEILALQRISCKLDRVIALFNTRTMDLKREGKL